MWSSVPIAVFVLVIQLVLPCYLAYDVWRSKNETRWAWCLRAAASAAFIGLLFVTGRWDVVGYYLRFLLPTLFVIAAVMGYVRARGVPWLVNGRPGAMMSLIGSIVSLALFAALLVYAVRGFRHDGEAVRLSSPLRGGTFYVGQGGDSPLINYHNTHATQRYAMDILELNDIGTRAASLYSGELERYVIFGRPVRSPCDGRIVTAVDGLVDNAPPETDRAQPTGNHVVVACHSVRVFLAHLQRGSVAVQPGASVASGDIVGRVGNSGNTSEPHLHVHAVRGGTDGTAHADVPVPILFDGTFAVRNTILGEVN
jgi:branched-subunit amino acid transport protein AzlD